MENKIALLIAETIFYIEEVSKIEKKYYFIKVCTLPFTKKELGPHATKELNNVKNIINHYYNFVTVSFRDEGKILDMFLSFHFEERRII
ncbi:MAG: hypothetical protein IKF82_07510 [Bacilli bacterium]|nr:hypothetical protein [Bacilli bacterium]